MKLGIISQKIEIIIATSMRISNAAELNSPHDFCCGPPKNTGIKLII
jgi:hypothetical protein